MKSARPFGDGTCRSHLASRAVASAMLIAVALANTACTQRTTRTFDKVLLISIDTLRADYLGSYGGPPGLTPELDEFAASAVLFDDAITQATSTLPSHSSLFYSLHTFVHQAYTGDPPQPLMVTPTEKLRDRGYRTAAFVGGGQLRPEFHLDRGFETYEVVNTRDLNDETFGQDRLDDLLTKASQFLRRHGSEPFFLFLHTYEPHYPYDPPARFIDEARSLRGDAPGIQLDAPLVGYEEGLGVPAEAWVADERRTLYAASVRYVDHFFGRLMRRIEALQLDQQVVVVFMADHGESLGERGLIGHNLFPTEQLRVPLIVKVPGLPAARRSDPVQLIDVMPTLFSLLGEEPPYPFMGLDLAPVLLGNQQIEADRVRISENKGRGAVLRRPWKAIFDLENHRSFQLYDLEADPGELSDRAAERPALAVELIREYEDLVARHQSLWGLFERRGGNGIESLDPEIVRELRAMGYIQ